MTHRVNFSALVVGAGSIGRRHLRNLRTLGIQQLAACDPDPARLTPMATELGIVPFTSFDLAISAAQPDLVFICSPPVFHVAQALQAVQAQADVFVEKPLSHALDDVDKLIAQAEASQRIVQVGYNLRFHPGLQRVKRLIDDNAIGRILWVYAEFGQYLPDWRPWQDYRYSYTARRSLGGGIILDSSHELDYLIWLLGQPKALICNANNVSNLQVDVEDCATILMRFPRGTQVDIHLDFVQRSYTRLCKLVGEQGTLIWDYVLNQVRLYDISHDDWQIFTDDFEANQMYLAEMEQFLTCVTHRKRAVVTLQDGVQALQLALAAHRSASEGRWISVGG